MRVLLKTDGTASPIEGSPTLGGLAKMLGAKALDTVSHVHDGKHVMFVDDLGHQKGLPVNDVATRLYHARCKPGSNPPPIVGDVVVLPMYGEVL